jgi:cytochrome c553
LRLFRPRVTSIACAAILVSVAQPARQATWPPQWAYPVNAPNLAEPPAGHGVIRVPRGATTFLPEQLTDLFSAPDWHPEDHPAMPGVVARGRQPGVYACGYCHLPNGAGRPENASLAGLPAAYIVRQVEDFRSGARRTAVPARIPPQLMIELARLATAAEIDAAADYFSHLPPQFLIKVIETATVPPTHVAGWILAADTTAPPEPIGQRIIEVPEDLEQFEHRDSRSRFLAYVPLGAVKAGARLAAGAVPNRTLACAGCHGRDLKGTGLVPGIAGRSPSYLVRQLVDIQCGLRAGAGAAPMRPVVQGLRIEDMIAIAAYLATLE